MDCVLVVRSLSFDGVEVGGTYHGRTVIIANYGIARGSTDRWIEECFHHEVSSLMLHAHRSVFPQAKWNRALPGGFSYGTGGFSAVREGRARETPEVRHLSCGFVCEYSRAALEEDFNTLAERLWSGDPRIWKWQAQHSRFAEKLETMLLFLSRVDARLSEAWFRSLSRDAPAAKAKTKTKDSPPAERPSAAPKPSKASAEPTPAPTPRPTDRPLPLPWLRRQAISAR